MTIHDYTRDFAEFLPKYRYCTDFKFDLEDIEINEVTYHEKDNGIVELFGNGSVEYCVNFYCAEYGKLVKLYEEEYLPDEYSEEDFMRRRYLGTDPFDLEISFNIQYQLNNNNILDNTVSLL